ncbi:MAG: hypothetical protein COB20_04005 [SAR86 cluster bacterium]|uniref:Uncharacterized protein n=1 Tax=SAR86 cluster bacterium TaxID=2030880 RepID=A0A2A4XCI4_9GAMM|nr:MAG: hypothetical protein COB20_04005 [SAR86 cluster bacterium]
MKTLTAAILIGLMIACSPEPEGGLVENEVEATRSDGTGSFKMANREIREETLQMLGDAGIEYWIGDDGAINYNLVDGEEIDKIGNDVILTYIRRN